jgi:hypothetical protein
MGTNDNFKRLAMSENGFLFDPQTGHSYTVNEVSMEILSCLKKGMDEPGIIKHIMDNYDVVEDQIKRDYNSFVVKLKQYSLYEETDKELAKKFKK